MTLAEHRRAGSAQLLVDARPRHRASLAVAGAPDAGSGDAAGEPDPRRRPPALLFGIGIDDVDMDASVAIVEALAVDGRRCGRTHQVATVNVDFLVNALDDSDNRRILQHAALCLPDGMPVVWAARLAGTPLSCRVAGVDLVTRLVERSAVTGMRLHLVGGAPGVVRRAVDRFRTDHPLSNVTGEELPLIDDVRRVDGSILRSIRAHDADVVAIALGNPKQEQFIDLHHRAIGAPVMIGIGGALDMVTGDKRRAPAWVQRAGLEWAVRAAQEPVRLGRRYARDGFVFGPRLAAHLRHGPRYRDAPPLSAVVWPSMVSISSGGSTAEELGECWHAAVRGVLSGATLRIDLAGVRTLSLPTLAMLVGLLRLACAHDVPHSITAVGDELARELDRLGSPLDVDGRIQRGAADRVRRRERRPVGVGQLQPQRAG